MNTSREALRERRSDFGTCSGGPWEDAAELATRGATVPLAKAPLAKAPLCPRGDRYSAGIRGCEVGGAKAFGVRVSPTLGVLATAADDKPTPLGPKATCGSRHDMWRAHGGGPRGPKGTRVGGHKAPAAKAAGKVGKKPTDKQTKHDDALLRDNVLPGSVHNIIPRYLELEVLCNSTLLRVLECVLLSYVQ